MFHGSAGLPRTVSYLACERFDVSDGGPSGKKNTEMPEAGWGYTYLTNDPMYSGFGVICCPISSIDFSMFIVAMMLAINNHAFASANAFPGQTRLPNPKMASTW